MKQLADSITAFNTNNELVKIAQNDLETVHFTASHYDNTTSEKFNAGSILLKCWYKYSVMLLVKSNVDNKAW